MVKSAYFGFSYIAIHEYSINLAQVLFLIVMYHPKSVKKSNVNNVIYLRNGHYILVLSQGFKHYIN